MKHVRRPSVNVQFASKTCEFYCNQKKKVHVFLNCLVFLCFFSPHTNTETLHTLLHQWSSPNLPLTSQQVVFHLFQIAPVCHPKLCLQSCLPTPLQHMAHLIGLRTSFWICKGESCIIIRYIQMRLGALIGICGGQSFCTGFTIVLALLHQSKTSL